VRFRVLGSVEVWDGRTWSVVRAAKQRELLAIMLLRPRRTLDRDWLVETLWDGEAPASASHLLPHYVWRLRELLPGGAELLRTVPSGYRFELVDDDLDRRRFEWLVTEGRTAARAGRSDQSIGTLSAALDLWRGPALADARTLPLLGDAAHHLEQRRLEARELLAETLIAADRPADAVATLEDLTAGEPRRERPWRLLMLALHASGRRPDALDTFRRLWHVWREQLGIAPSYELRELHRRILMDDPVLREGAAPRRTRRPSRRRPLTWRPSTGHSRPYL